MFVSLPLGRFTQLYSEAGVLGKLDQFESYIITDVPYGNGVYRLNKWLISVERDRPIFFVILVVAVLFAFLSFPVHPSDAHSELPHRASSMSTMVDTYSVHQNARVPDLSRVLAISGPTLFRDSRVIDPLEHPPQ